MTTHDFTFLVGGIDIENDADLDRLFEAGCDDATVALMRGFVACSFARDADSYVDAVLSARTDLISAGATIERFDPDYLVSSADIAERVGLTRQAVSLYDHGKRGAGYPRPVARVLTPNPLWDWVDVARWFVQNGKADETVYRAAQVSRGVNQNTPDANIREALTLPLAA